MPSARVLEDLSRFAIRLVNRRMRACGNQQAAGLHRRLLANHANDLARLHSVPAALAGSF